MNKDADKVCPYLESSHSVAKLHYVCTAVKGDWFEIRASDIDVYPCFTAGYKNCRHYLNATSRKK